MTARSKMVALLLLLWPAAIATTSSTDPVVTWIKRTAHPFDTCAPRDDQRDLAFLDKLVGDAHIVALGEGTHGTSEFFQMKHRVVRYLATKKGFTVFAIEANMPEAYRVNDYVLTGRGDPRALLDGMYFWTWDTHEVLDMIEWMRAFNASGKGRIQFTGFDMQTPDTAAAIARRTLAKVDTAAVDSVSALLRQLQQSRSGANNAFATATGTLPVADLAGHHVRYSGWIRTRDVVAPGFAGLWMRADSTGRNAIAFDNMRSQGVNGTRDWKRYTIELDIPRGTTNINFGMLLDGQGKAWFDSLRIDLDGVPWKGDGHHDLALEESGTPSGFGLFGGSAYQLSMQDSVVHDGTRALSIRSIGTPAPPGTPPAPTPSPVAAARRLLERVEGERAALAAATTPAEADWAIQNVGILDQCARMVGAGPGGSAVRDSSMAQNIDWILAHEKPGTRIVLWAHNWHVSRRDGWMGSHLARVHGTDMVVIGFATYSGQYTAFGDGKLKSNDLEMPTGDAFEALCHATSAPRFVLDVRRTDADAAAKKYFAEPRLMRSIGALATADQFFLTPIPRYFDAIVFVDTTTATKLMHPTP